MSYMYTIYMYMYMFVVHVHVHVQHVCCTCTCTIYHINVLLYFRRLACLKYVVLANMLMKSAIDPFDSQEVSKSHHLYYPQTHIVLFVG